MAKKKRLTKEQIWESPRLSKLEFALSEHRHYDELEVEEVLTWVDHLTWFVGEPLSFPQFRVEIEKLKAANLTPIFVHAVLYLLGELHDLAVNSCYTESDRRHFLGQNAHHAAGLILERDKAARLAWPEVAEKFTWERFILELEGFEDKAGKLNFGEDRLAEFTRRRSTLPFLPTANFSDRLGQELMNLRKRIIFENQHINDIDEEENTMDEPGKPNVSMVALAQHYLMEAKCEREFGSRGGKNKEEDFKACARKHGDINWKYLSTRLSAIRQDPQARAKAVEEQYESTKSLLSSCPKGLEMLNIDYQNLLNKKR